MDETTTTTAEWVSAFDSYYELPPVPEGSFVPAAAVVYAASDSVYLYVCPYQCILDEHSITANGAYANYILEGETWKPLSSPTFGSFDRVLVTSSDSASSLVDSRPASSQALSSSFSMSDFQEGHVTIGQSVFEGADVTMVLSEVLGLVPLVMVAILGYLGIRKGISFIQSIFARG